jgi:hypothetical protein
VVDSLGLSSSDEKLKALSQLAFPRTLRQLESYLGLAGFLRSYIPHYAAVSKPLQKRKTALLKPSPMKGNARKAFSVRTQLVEPSWRELAGFKDLQALLASSRILVHFDGSRILWIDLDASKEFGFGAMVYHVKDDDTRDLTKYPPKTAIQPILFLSRLLSSAETRYWPTELEMAGMVWVVKKVRHMVESAKGTIIYTDHGANVGIAKQTSLTTSSTEKLNLRLVRASEYLQRFTLDIRHKPGKANYVSDALSRLATEDSMKPSSETDSKASIDQEGELDALHVAYAYTCSLVEMSPEFKQRLLYGYKEDPSWKKILSQLEQEAQRGEDAAVLPFGGGRWADLPD